MAKPFRWEVLGKLTAAELTEAQRQRRMASKRLPPKLPDYDSAPGICVWCARAVERGRWHKECQRAYHIARFSKDAIQACFERDAGVCAKCGWGSSPQHINEWYADHITPLWRVDREHPKAFWFWTIGNLQTLCRACHKKKTAEEATLRMSGSFSLARSF